MDSQTVFCPNPDCPARGQRDRSNIRVHSRKAERYRCTVCRQTFVARKGTAYYRLHKSVELMTVVITLLAYGCPLPAIVAAFGLDERTVSAWQQRAGEQCQRVHAHVVQHARDLGQVQADELYVKLQGLKAWLAVAMQVSTRLWLGGVIATQRDGALLHALVTQIRACALRCPLLLCVDGWRAYLSAIRQVFRDPLPRAGRRGRRRLQAWRGLYIAQVIKRYAKGHVVSVRQRIVQGRRAAVERLIAGSQGSGGINTAYIERLNATFRARLNRLTRRGRTLARQLPTLTHAMYLVGTVYNFCAFHDSMRVRRRGRPDQLGHRWHRRTPAMAAGLTDHRWSVQELLAVHVPLPRWTPPKRRGRLSNATKLVIAQWCT